MLSKKMGLFICLAVLVIACKKPAPPAEQVKGYIAAIDSLDYKNAAKYMLEVDKEAVEHNIDRVSDMTPERKAAQIAERRAMKYAFTEQEVTDTKAKVIVYAQHDGKINPINFKLKKKNGIWLIESIAVTLQ